MTRDELIDEILRLSANDPGDIKSVRGWFGVARDLLAGLVEQGLHLPDAAKVIRGEGPGSVPSHRRPLATVTLAEIYAAQGHLARGVTVLKEVLEKEPEHEVARRLLSDLEARGSADELDNFPEESVEWAEFGPDTPAESPSAISADERVAPALTPPDSPREPQVSPPREVELSVKGEPELEAPTLRTTELTGDQPTSDVPAAVAALEAEPASGPPAEIEATPEPDADPEIEAEPEPDGGEAFEVEVEEETSPDASKQPQRALVADQIPGEPAPSTSAELEDASGDLESPDSCVLFVSESRVVLSWRLTEASFARHLQDQPDGAPIVRLVWWAPGLPAARYSLDVAVTQASGELLVEPQGYDRRSALRGALGWLSRGSADFVVLATALVCSLGQEAEAHPVFRPHAAAPGPLDDRVEAARVLAERYA